MDKPGVPQTGLLAYGLDEPEKRHDPVLGYEIKWQARGCVASAAQPGLPVVCWLALEFAGVSTSYPL